MSAAARGIFIAGVAFAVGLGIALGLDAYGFVILALVIGCGWLGFALLHRTKDVAPARCDTCGGLISPNAPYCKHCGATVRA
jgi:hypothetical protein